MPEIVRDGESGYLVDSIAASVEAVRKTECMTPARVRASVEHRFDSTRMVDEYIAVYHRILALSRLRRK
jgi:hypothetical protein